MAVVGARIFHQQTHADNHGERRSYRLFIMIIWGFVCQKQVYRTWMSNYNPQYSVGCNHLMPYIYIHCTSELSPYRPIDPYHQSHNASEKYPRMHHFVTEMCTHVHISVTECCIVGYGTIALWDLLIRSIGPEVYTSSLVWNNRTSHAALFIHSFLSI